MFSVSSTKSHCATEIDYALFVFQGRRRKGAIYTFATGNGGLIGDNCAYSGYVNSIFTIAISGVNLDDSKPFYAEACAGIMASAYSRDPFKGVGKVVSEVVKLFGYGLLFALLPQKRSLSEHPFKDIQYNHVFFGNKSLSLFYNFVNMTTTSSLSTRGVVIFFTIFTSVTVGSTSRMPGRSGALK